MKMSAKGIAFLKAREGEVLHVYKDSVGLLTVGVGHLLTDEDKKTLKLNQKITAEESTRLLRQDLARFEASVNRVVKVPLNQNQFDALVSLAFNIGEKGFSQSSVVRHLNNNDYLRAAHTILAWNRAGGEISKGLVTRRRLEKSLFLSVAPETASVMPIPKKGDKGEEVKEIQQRLITLKFLSVGAADGDFGAKTETAVEAFQTAAGLKADGIVGLKTRAKLFEEKK